MKKRSGFSLLELIIVVLISAILLLIAVPSYQSYIRKSRRIDGIQAIQAIRLIEEKYRASNPQYGTLEQIAGAEQSTGGYYNLSVTDISAFGYTIKAAAEGDQINDQEDGTACNELSFFVNNTVETKTPLECW